MAARPVRGDFGIALLMLQFLWRAIGRWEGRRRLPPASGRFRPAGGVALHLVAEADDRPRTPYPSIVSRLVRRCLSLLDDLIAFVQLERALVVRNVKLDSIGNPAAPFRLVIRNLLVINAHIWVFSALGRHTQGNTSFIVFYTCGFTIWNFFSWMERNAMPATVRANFSKSLNLKWIHLYLADAAWLFVVTMLPYVLTLGFYALVPVPTLGPPITFPPNLLLLFYVFFVAMALGAGLGMILHSAARRWPLADSIREPLNWFLFVSSGIYISYLSWPWWVRQYLWFDPITVLIEYCRLATYSGYITSDLSLPYATAFAFVLLLLGLCFRKWEFRTRPA